jgi:hypothetical protein
MTMFNQLRVGGNKQGESRGDAPMISLHVPHDLKAALASFAKTHGVNRSQAMRELMEIGLKAEQKEKVA